jgi:hypothetical protein
VEQKSQSISIRSLSEGDLPEANVILRLAFATHFGVPPDTFWTDRDFVTGRWLTDPSLAFGAWIEDRLVGSSLGASWGSLGVFGPISTHPDTWNRGTASSLLPPVLERLDALGARHIGFSAAIDPLLNHCRRRSGTLAWRVPSSNNRVAQWIGRHSRNTFRSQPWTRRHSLHCGGITSGGSGYLRIWP